MEKDNFLSQITDFIEKNGGRYIIAENGKPEFVIMNIKEYQKLLNRISPEKSDKEERNEDRELDKVNYELAVLKDEEILKESSFPRNIKKHGHLFSSEDIESLKKGENKEFSEPVVEDLPF